MSYRYNFKMTCPAMETKRFISWKATKSGPLKRRVLVGDYNHTGHTSFHLLTIYVWK